MNSLELDHISFTSHLHESLNAGIVFLHLNRCDQILILHLRQLSGDHQKEGNISYYKVVAVNLLSTSTV